MPISITTCSLPRSPVVSTSVRRLSLSRCGAPRACAAAQVPGRVAVLLAMSAPLVEGPLRIGTSVNRHCAFPSLSARDGLDLSPLSLRDSPPVRPRILEPPARAVCPGAGPGTLAFAAVRTIPGGSDGHDPQDAVGQHAR